ncbi:DNA-directed RNA polymerase subunit alpha [Mycoplasmoides fastidiosum]|uniref:DNA-directed RNA polymerase subunit alpha n=1 Tax=Mycoplasmoides fastidiosum TaxID=92758 RepID=A0ABU0LY38_9BACT|nr:DNA-directed RNA polymerase subunit alpha [Mycoplasmoides fastidiosum]MDQ0513609.1 DNA-directed RNA polymerase subunit alpha [Mycoplasmoides fastidiosum]UUD37968.1 DNA-directed RNA polymerase subunit alpha [Mycoplasmoides fastidiosum]
MQKFSKYRIEPIIEATNPNLGTFVFDALEQGFGTTLGNALRRVLLSSIHGASVFAIKIPGITHEYTTIKGVVQDLTHIIWNIKKLTIKVNERIVDLDELSKLEIEKWPTLKINKKGKGIVYARDIICPVGFEILNGDLEICEIADNTNFVMDLYITVDRGYRSFHENRELISSINIIAIDSSFSPILRVAYKVTEQKTTKWGVTERLEIKIATDGSISASNALSLAARILSSHLEPIVSINHEISQLEIIRKEEDQYKKAVLSTPIDELELTMRSFNSLKRNGIHTIQELIDRPKSSIEQIRNLGKKSLKEIMRKLADRNLTFNEEPSN